MELNGRSRAYVLVMVSESPKDEYASYVGNASKSRSPISILIKS